jgi:NTE family protein
MRNVESPCALVLCGGCSRGALEVGFYRAIRELGLPVDMILGSSIGALNGAYIAAGMSTNCLAELWRTFRRRDGVHWNWRELAKLYRCSGLFSLDPLRNVLRRTLPVSRFEDLTIPLAITTTDLQAGKAVYWQGSGDLIEPLIASMSLPALFPPVQIDGRQHVDGGISDDVPLEHAIAAGARHVLIVSCGHRTSPPEPFRGLVNVLARSFSVAIDSKHDADLQRFRGAAQLHVVRPILPRAIAPLDFQYTEELMAIGYRETILHFDAGQTARHGARSVRRRQKWSLSKTFLPG